MIAAEASPAGLLLRAISAGGIETCFQVPDFELCLDIGRCPPGAERWPTLLLTHGHIDHAAGLPYYVSLRRLYGYPPARVYCPAASVEPIRKILSAWTELQTNSEECELIGVRPGDLIPLGKGRWARAFASPHRIATVGYTLYREVKKLRPDLLGLPGPAIAARVAAGEEVNVKEERLELCFPGDARIEVLDWEPTTQRARVLLLECTFLGEGETPNHAKEGGHIHLDQVAARAEHFQNRALVLTHFSRRYSVEQIERAVAQRLPAELLARTWLLTHPSPAGPGRLAPAAPAPAR